MLEDISVFYQPSVCVTLILTVGPAIQDLSTAVSAEEVARYLDLKKLDERVYMFEAVSAYDG